MIVDLNLKGKSVLIIGGGTEAVRKVDGLLTQNCSIHVVTENASEDILRFAGAGKIHLKEVRVETGRIVNQYENLVLVMAVTDDRDLNREIVKAARKVPCYAYSADDPEVSDFGHPTVINLFDTVQVAISTGGKSPLMAKRLRELTEPVLNDIIKKSHILQIQLQDKLRGEAKKVLTNPEKRKDFLKEIFDDDTIREFLEKNQSEHAEMAAMEKLKKFIENN